MIKHICGEYYPFLVEYYETSNGKYPAEEFILSLSLKVQARVFRTIELLEEYGSELRMPYSRYLRDGIFELRIQAATDKMRILYFFITGERIILTNGFVKRTRKAPEKELELALKYKREYEKRVTQDGTEL